MTLISPAGFGTQPFGTSPFGVGYRDVTVTVSRLRRRMVTARLVTR